MAMDTAATPGDLGAPAMAEMRRATTSGPPAWVRYTPWLAAAAVVVGLLAVTLPNIGSSSNDSGGIAAQDSAPSETVAPQDLRLEIVDQDLDTASLEAAADAFARGERTADPNATAGAVEAATPVGSQPPFALASRSRSNRALECLRTAFPGFPGTPVRLVSASFQGQQAFFAYVVEGPGADQPADRVSIWVASASGCSSLALTSAAL